MKGMMTKADSNPRWSSKQIAEVVDSELNTVEQVSKKNGSYKTS